MVKTGRQNRTGVTVAMLMAAAAIGLTACDTVKSSGVDPIDWYRDLSGDAKNDPQDQAANSKNLKEGSKEPYPNLASVPKQPDNAITKADRDKMAQSLVADRQNAQYTDQQLRAGQNLQAVAPPAPESPASSAPKVATAPPPAPAAASTPPQKTAATRPPAPPTEKMPAVPVPPVKQEVLPAPNQTASANPPPASPVSAPSAASPARSASAPSKPTVQPPAQQVAMAPIVDEKDHAQAQAVKPKADEPKKQAAKPKTDEQKKQQQARVKRGAEPPPEESALRPPAIGTMPTGEESRAAPPPPEEVAAAPPPRTDVDGAKGGTGRSIEIDFAPGPFKARILPADHNRLAEVAKLAQRSNARIRIVGYGGAAGHGDSAEREFQSFNAALDNAKAVGIELAKLGVPASRIDIETKANINSPDRAVIFVER